MIFFLQESGCAATLHDDLGDGGPHSLIHAISAPSSVTDDLIGNFYTEILTRKVGLRSFTLVKKYANQLFNSKFLALNVIFETAL